MPSDPDPGVPTVPAAVSAAFGIAVERSLGGRASRNWSARRDDRLLVLRETPRMPWQTADTHRAAVRWRRRAQSVVRDRGWPAAEPVAEPMLIADGWWTLESFLPGTAPDTLSAERWGSLLAEFHGLEGGTRLGPQPGLLDQLAAVDRRESEALIGVCEDAEDRHWLTLRLRQARELAARCDLGAGPRHLVHGDFVTHNLLFTGDRLIGLLDFELATVDHRTAELVNAWRCRYDDRLLAYHAARPLADEEWPVLLLRWWSCLLALAFVHLEAGRQPDRWELDGLRRTTPIAERLTP